jgi:hypothetical protein
MASGEAFPEQNGKHVEKAPQCGKAFGAMGTMDQGVHRKKLFELGCHSAGKAGWVLVLLNTLPKGGGNVDNFGGF